MASNHVARCDGEQQGKATRQNKNNKVENKLKKKKTLTRIKTHNTHETKKIYAKFQGLWKGADGMRQLQPNPNFFAAAKP